MKKILLLSIALVAFLSCTTDDSVTPQSPSTVGEYIYFSGWDESIGVLGVKWSELYRMKLDGTNQEKLTDYSNSGTIGGYADYPILNSTSTKVYFSRESTIKAYDIVTTITSAIYTAPATSGWINTTNQVFDNDTKILFVEENDTKAYNNINVLDIQSGIVTLLTDAQDVSTSYSTPVYYNNKIYYLKTSNVWNAVLEYWEILSHDICSMNIDGSNKTLLHQIGGGVTDIAVLNDSTLYFTKRMQQNLSFKVFEIWKLDLATNTTTQISVYATDGNIEELALHDNQIYYSSEKTGKYNIYKMDLDGNNNIMVSVGDSVDKQMPAF